MPASFSWSVRALPIATAIALLPMPTLVAEVQLTTLPARDQVGIRFQRDDQALVEESRTLTLSPGLNHLDFTWNGVGIDPRSVLLLPSTGVPFVVVREIDGQGEDSRRWEVVADAAGEAAVHVAYELTGVRREVGYRAVIESPTQLGLHLEERLRNDSGESFALASIQADGRPFLPTPWQTGEIRQQDVLRVEHIPYRIEYTYDPSCDPAVQITYVIVNEAAAGLGHDPLPAGRIRLFRVDADRQSFLGEDSCAVVPVGGPLRFRIGAAKDLAVARRAQAERYDVQQWSPRDSAVLWNSSQTIAYDIDNHTDGERTLRLVEPIAGQWEIDDPHETLQTQTGPDTYADAPSGALAPGRLERTDASTLTASVPVPAGHRIVLTYTIHRFHLH